MEPDNEDILEARLELANELIEALVSSINCLPVCISEFIGSQNYELLQEWRGYGDDDDDDDEDDE